jgi:hypothetical protein
MPAIVLWALALLISAGGLLVSVNSHRFARGVGREAHSLWATPRAPTPSAATPFTDLPAPVRRYLQLAGVEGRAPLQATRIRHHGTMTLAPDAQPLPIRGRQYLAADPPGFVWWGRVRLGPGLWIDARDKVIDGAAGMRVMVQSTKLLQDVTGSRLDQGALTRLLGELTWVPTTLADRRYVTWEPINDHSARARLRVNGREVAAVFHFGADGLPARFTTDRFRDIGGGLSRLTPFVGVTRDWRNVDGLRVPFEIEGSWILDGKPYTFARFHLDSVEFDRPAPFRS